MLPPARPCWSTSTAAASSPATSTPTTAPADVHWYDHRYGGPVEGGADRRDPRYSPLRAARLDGAAPAVVAVAGFDPLRDEGDAYATALTAAGVPVTHLRFPGLLHG